MVTEKGSNIIVIVVVADDDVDELGKYLARINQPIDKVLTT